MAIFYTDSGSFNNLEVTGSTILSGSLIVSGATNFGPSGLTGSLFGTASNATSASFATTASFALNGGGASTPAFPFSGSAVITGSLLVSGSSNISGALNLAGPSSYGAGSSIGSIRFNFPSTAIDTSSGQFIIDFDQAYDDSEYNRLRITNTIAQNTSTGVGAVYNQVTLQNTDLYVESINSTNNGTLAGFQAIAGQTGSIPRMQGDLLIISRTASFGTILGNGNVGLGPALVLISGSTQMTGSLGVLGTVLVNGQVSASSYTSSLNNQVGFLGTSSFAVSSSQAISASWAPGGSGTGFPFSGSAVITGSLFISQSISGTPALRGTGSIDFVTGSTRINTAVTGINLITGNGLGSDANISLNNAGPFIEMSAGGTSVSISATGVLPAFGAGNQLGEQTEGDNYRWGLYSTFIDNSGNITTTAITASNARINGSVSASSYTSSLNNQVGYFGTSSFAVSSSRATTASFASTAPYNELTGVPAGIVSSSTQFNSLTAPFTGSFTGSFSGSLDRFNPVALRLTVGTTAPTSPAVNDLWVDTN